MTAIPAVQGHCPACHRTTLILGADGYVTCAHLDCPNPTAASDLLDQQTDNSPNPVAQLVRTLEDAPFSVLVQAFRQLDWTMRFTVNEPATTTPEEPAP